MSSLDYRPYTSEQQLPDMVDLIERDLSEPYSIYTYRYFLMNFPQLSSLVYDGNKCVGVVVSKIDEHKSRLRGYIGMLAVDKEYRSRGIATELVLMSLKAMIQSGATEVSFLPILMIM